ncbi:hypothetical protein [Thiohalorhabdus methylotrophus]|uniref:Uncharacterized protein n=1 Tax=Thiohalorhabdus methylotrophus TaxID=3242694 RepID=A0ABV4TVN1_9GAMM
MADPSQRSNWLIPAAVLGAAVLLLVLLHQLVGGPHLPAPEDSTPREAAIRAVRTAPADPFRYGGRTVGSVLGQIEPRTGWRDAGWSVRPLAEGGFRVVRTYRREDGAERTYAFTVAADRDRVWPANGRARSLMHRGPRPEA